MFTIAKWLKTNFKLRYLVITRANATSRSGAALAEALREDTTLAISFNVPCGPTSGRAFASMLEVNSSLRFLGLDTCQLESEGCRSFIDAWAVNRTLKTLLLNCSDLHTQDRLRLVRVAKRAGVLIRLEVDRITLMENGNYKPSRHRMSSQFQLGSSLYCHLVGLQL